MARPTTTIIDVGDRFGRLTVVEIDLHFPPTPGGLARGFKTGHRAVRISCDCGSAPRLMRVETLARGRARGCGCLRAGGNEFHGHSVKGSPGYPLYNRWGPMMDRCYDPSDKDYCWYGGRGIKVADRWHSRLIFVRDVLELLGPCPEGMSIDRVDVNGDYEPSNIRYATALEQTLNRRVAHREV